MTREQFRDAIAKGLGRVPQYLRTHPSESYRDIIREACVKNLAWDPQSEGARPEYLFDIMNLSDEYEALAREVVHTLRTSDDDHDLWQALSLAGLIASQGDADARAAIYERFDRTCDPRWGAEEILKLDGIEGFLEVLRRLGRAILAGDELHIDGFSLSFARDEFGKDFRERLIDPVAAHDPEIRASLEAIDREEGKERPRPKLWSMSYPEMKQAVEQANGRVGMGLQFWVKAASEEDVLRLAQDLLAETRPAFLLTYLRAFFRHPFPLELGRLLEIADNADDKLSHAAAFALAAIQNPAVRDFGVDLLRRRHRLKNAFRLFRRNYQPGDHALFKEVLQTVQTTPELAHHIGLNICDTYRQRNVPESQAPLLWVYENTPCSMCRGSSFELLVNQHLAPEEIIRECLDDCSLETREVARQALAAAHPTGE